MAELSPLRRRMIEDMTVRNLSPATQRSYIHAVLKFSRYFGRSPDRLDLEDVRAFQVHLVATGISWPALNQTVCALRFFYGVTLGHGEIPERIPYAREPRKLPVVLSADEVVRFLEAVPSLKTRAALTTAYAAGLRAPEAVGLKVGAIDSGRMVIRVEHGKGGKDRYVMLSAQRLRILRSYWRLARPKDWLFPGRGESKPIDVQVLYSACRSACVAAGLGKRVTVHTLRHSPHGEFVEPRHASSGGRHRHPHHPGAARPQHADLIDPAFINAERYSLLQRAHLAQAQHAPDGTGCRFELVTNWRIKANDPLLELVRKESDALDLARLFEGKTDGSRMGRVRKLWCDHLGVDHAGLALVARTLAVGEFPESLASLRERLDDRFAAVGMKRVPAGEAGFFYDDLAAKLLAQGRVEFDREAFRKMAEQENLIDPAVRPAGALAIGIRSFMHPIDPLEDRCAQILNLVRYFDGRYIRNEADWQEQIHPALAAFVLGTARASEHLRLIIDAHASLAFATGALLNVKSGKRIGIEQRFGGRRFWSMDDQPVNQGWAPFEFDEEIVDPSGDEIALAIGLTHDVAGGVRAFVRARAPAIGRILHCRLRGRASQQSVVCGRHAWMLAESTVQQVRRLRESGAAKGRAHLFIAGPNAFTFFLGQHQQALGPVSSYEWDFDGQRGGGYSHGLTLGG